jgi:hypothetical protein
VAEQAKWTILVYLAGDNNLSAAGENDLAEMRAVGSSDDVNIVAQFDCAGDLGTNRYLIRRAGADEPSEDLGEVDSGDPQTLIDFVGWTGTHYPAERYALVLWNHGSGWDPLEVNRIARSVGAPAYTPREAGERASSPLGKVLFRTTWEEILKQPTPLDRAICSDDGSGHSLDTIELGRVLTEVVAALGQPLDILGMDACLMSNVEVAYQARPFAKYMVASEELEPNDGWPYDAVFRELVANPDLPTADLTALIVRSYIDSYVRERYPDPVTMAALDLSKVDTLTGPLDTLADRLTGRMADSNFEMFTAQTRAARFYNNTLWDIAHFCEELGGATADGGVRQAAEEVRAALRPGPDRLVVAEAHNGDAVARCGGATIYFQSPLTRISPYYAELDFAKDRRWLAMLEAYHAAN